MSTMAKANPVQAMFKQRRVLLNVNRVAILTLTLSGLLMDGYQRSDLPYLIALVVWLWLPQCTRIEANIIGRVSTRLHHNLSRPVGHHNVR